MDKKKIIFFVTWLGLIAITPYTVFTSTPFGIAFANPAVSVNTFQRLFGLLAFTLIFVQIILGSNMHKLTEKLGSWIFKFHIVEGLFTYSLVILHPLTFVLFNYLIKGVFDPFYVYTDLCVICKNRFEFFYTFGRLTFWMITATVIAAYFRSHPLLFKHWRKIHILNYVVFFLVFVHGLNVGSDFKTQPFWSFAIFATVLVPLAIARRLLSIYSSRRAESFKGKLRYRISKDTGS